MVDLSERETRWRVSSIDLILKRNKPPGPTSQLIPSDLGIFIPHTTRLYKQVRMGHIFCCLFCTFYTKDQLTTGNGRCAPPAYMRRWVSHGTWEQGHECGVHASCFQSKDFRPCTDPHSTHSAHFAAGTLKETASALF